MSSTDCGIPIDGVDTVTPSHLLIQILREHHSTNKVQVSYFVGLPQSNFPDNANSLTFPWLWAFSSILAKFPDISRFPEKSQFRLRDAAIYEMQTT